jgi:PAS domain S-box-containing protein
MQRRKQFYGSLSTLMEAATDRTTANLAIETMDYCLEELNALKDRAEARMQSAAAWSATSDLMVILTCEGTILEANEGLCQKLGRPMERLVGRPVWDLVSEEYRDAHRQVFESCVKLQRPLVFEAEGYCGWAEVLLQPVAPEYGVGLVICMIRILEGRSRRWSQASMDGKGHRARIIE